MSKSPHTVLVVEDEPWIRLALVHHLEDCDFRVLEAASVREAITALEQSDVDLVFTDLRLLGDRGGIDLARWVARNRPGVPVMLTSGEMGVDGLAELCRSEGFVSFGKPYAHAEVSAQIRKLIEKRKRDAPDPPR
ncbi:MAG TPA: response regulator [Rhizomicrobium sp.]|nr:response regulator [Rhizomicrobium sp.]